MNPQDNNPSGRPPSLYQMSNQPERKGGGGMIVFALVVLLLAGGGAYYFLKAKHPPVTAAAALPASATPTPAVAAATPPEGYNSVTEQSYIDQADKAFMEVQQPKIKAFNDAFAAFKAAGYVNAKGLTSKEAVAARRELIAKCLAANDEYAAFVATQETTYKDDLAKTPLTPADAKSTLDDYATKAKTADVVKLRQAEHDYLKSGDDMMAALEKWAGNWSLSPEGKLSFKRKENIAEYNELARKANASANLVAKLQSEYSGTVLPASGAATAAAAASAEGAASAPAPAAASPAPTHP